MKCNIGFGITFNILTQPLNQTESFLSSDILLICVLIAGKFYVVYSTPKYMIDKLHAFLLKCRVVRKIVNDYVFCALSGSNYLILLCVIISSGVLIILI